MDDHDSAAGGHPYDLIRTPWCNYSWFAATVFSGRRHRDDGRDHERACLTDCREEAWLDEVTVVRLAARAPVPDDDVWPPCAWGPLGRDQISDRLRIRSERSADIGLLHLARDGGHCEPRDARRRPPR